MFKFFSRGHDKQPRFTALESSPLRSKYFVRTAQFVLMPDGEHIHIIRAARVFTLDPFPQMVFLAATGDITVESFVRWLADQYGPTERVPLKLDREVLYNIASLLEHELIVVSDTPLTLADDVANPVS
jgi:hypothetical protein